MDRCHEQANDRRGFLKGGLAAAAVLVVGAAPARASAVWTFDDLRRVGGRSVRTVGDPQLTDSPWGRATYFDGTVDGLLLDAHPLAGATAFSVEAWFRPDGGAFEQRWLHLESDQTPPVRPGTGDTRLLFEIRVVDQFWYLDSFMTGPGYRKPLMAPDKLFPIGRWYHVAQSFDGTTYRSFVDGALQAEAPLSFVPQEAGRASVGMRMNRASYFHGVIRAARFMHLA